jgi:beta-lactam-binding protein with PASTA domain
VLGLDEGSAQAELENAGFSVEVVDETVFLPDNEGIVLAQDPGPGSEVDPGTTVTIVVGRFILGDGGDETGAATDTTDTTTIG